MDYVIINGKKSTLVKGLLIQSLPMISRPLMRAKIEEIDGRDGDIITKLGYSAYDKVLKIGLYGDYDVDEVIRYFNQNGKVIFSNELDKYYRFDILNQIDFEKLLRFKQANVIFHCQPFKYSAVDETLLFDTTGLTSIKVYNRGNVESRPRISFTASGSTIFYLYINGTQLLVINSINNQTIVIDAEQMNAYIGADLANRKVYGDYNTIKLATGENTISWTCFTGAITQVTVENFARWI